MITKEDMTAIEHNEKVIVAYNNLIQALKKENSFLDKESVQYCQNEIEILKVTQTISQVQRLLEYRKKKLEEDLKNFDKETKEANKNFDFLIKKIRSNEKYNSDERIKKLLLMECDLSVQEQKNRLYRELTLQVNVIDKNRPI